MITIILTFPAGKCPHYDCNSQAGRPFQGSKPVLIPVFAAIPARIVAGIALFIMQKAPMSPFSPVDN
ncbi:MAG: hypothetical protein AAGM33_02185 [Pseudomonadota bacterium]